MSQFQILPNHCACRIATFVPCFETLFLRTLSAKPCRHHDGWESRSLVPHLITTTTSLDVHFGWCSHVGSDYRLSYRCRLLPQSHSWSTALVPAIFDPVQWLRSQRWPNSSDWRLPRRDCGGSSLVSQAWSVHISLDADQFYRHVLEPSFLGDLVGV